MDKCAQDHCGNVVAWRLYNNVGLKEVCGLHLSWGCRSMTRPGESVVVVPLEEVEVNGARTAGIVSTTR